jgi:SsrA-binding protein
MTQRDIAQNRKAFHDYLILDRIEVGIVLEGSEVKALRQGLCNLKDSHALIENGEVHLVNCHIGAFGPAGPFNHYPERKRKLLLHRREIDNLFGKVVQKGLTLIPLRVYWLNNHIKIELGLCQGKKLYDKRHALKEQELRREAQVVMSRNR